MSFFAKLWRDESQPFPGPQQLADMERVRQNLEFERKAEVERLRQSALETDRQRITGLAEELILSGNKPEWAVKHAWRYAAAMAKVEGRKIELRWPGEKTEPTPEREDAS